MKTFTAVAMLAVVFAAAASAAPPSGKQVTRAVNALGQPDAGFSLQVGQTAYACLGWGRRNPPQFIVCAEAAGRQVKPKVKPRPKPGYSP